MNINAENSAYHIYFLTDKLETLHSNQLSSRLVYFNDLLPANGTWSELLAILVVRVEVLCMLSSFFTK